MTDHPATPQPEAPPEAPPEAQPVPQPLSGDAGAAGDRTDLAGQPGDAVDEAPPPYGALLRVQDLDTAVSQLEHRRETMPERAALKEVETTLASLSARESVLGAEGVLLSQRLAELERELEASAGRRAAIERRMMEAGLAARDLQAMDAEVHHLEQRRSEIEDQQLAVMEDQEPVEAELAVMDADRGRLEAAAAELRVAIAAAGTAIGAEVSALQLARGVAAGEVPAELLDRYETLRRHLGGTGAARLIGNRCDGCHLELPSVEVERVRRLPADALVTCDQCGRILVRTTGPRRS